MTYMEGWINFNLERWEEAAEGFENSLSLLRKMDDHSWAWTYILLGGAYHNLGVHKQEQRVFEEGQKFWPEHKSTFDYWQAVCAASQGDSLKAAQHLDEIRVVLEQRGWSEGNILAWYAGAFGKGESFEVAEEYYREAYSLKPEDYHLHYEFALFLIENDINVEEGMELIRPVAEKYSENAAYLYTYGLGLFKQGEYQKALEVLIRSWENNPYYDHKVFRLKNEIEDILDRN